MNEMNGKKLQRNKYFRHCRIGARGADLRGKSVQIELVPKKLLRYLAKKFIAF
jgi:hypothetical protein